MKVDGLHMHLLVAKTCEKTRMVVFEWRLEKSNELIFLE